ncbi:MAG TPA: hypothetical protein VM284_05520 [Candidatus Limnocylindria bacterium]|nr:hypothetical protein [Candidatus Limnocylindria bacterium]
MTASPYSPPTAGDFPSGLVEGLRVEVDTPFTSTVDCGPGLCQIPLDILAPESGASLPTFVLIPGGPTIFADRRYMDLIATGLARRGAVVFLATYRSSAIGADDDDTPFDIQCAIQFARAHTIDYGGDPELLVLVGHSFASPLVIQTGANAELSAPACLADADGVPNAILALSEFDPATPLGTPNGIPFRLACGSLDTCSAAGAAMAEQLQDAGFDAEYLEFTGVDHIGMVDPGTSRLLDMYFQVAELAGQ